MKKFNITENVSIEAFDKYNWVVRLRRQPAVRESTKKIKTNELSSATLNEPSEGLESSREDSTAVFGYYPTLSGALSGATGLLEKTTANFSEVKKWVDEIERIYKLFAK